MENLPEDQQRNEVGGNGGSPPSSPEPEGAVALPSIHNPVQMLANNPIPDPILAPDNNQPANLQNLEENLVNLNIQQPLEVEVNQNAVHQIPHQQPLLLRHASVSSLDECSQKYRGNFLYF